MPEPYAIEFKDTTTKNGWEFYRYTAVFNDKHKAILEGILKERGSNGIEFRLVKEHRHTIDDFIKQAVGAEV